MLGFGDFGSGQRGVIVLNDWLCDTSTWNEARAYLDPACLRWAFADLRGYGRSRDQPGEFTLTEAAGDVLELADALGWLCFALVGHSMSSLIALHVAQQAPERIARVVALTPPPPTGFGVDDARLAAMQSMARGDDARRLNALRSMWGDRLSDSWIRFKAERWRATSDANAVASYIPLFARHGLPDPSARIKPPLLAVTGEHDAPPMRAAAVTAWLPPLCDAFEHVSLTDSGHYPMQETPPLFASVIQKFLTAV